MSLVPPFMSTDSATRKLMPVASGVLAYFPDALMCVSWISRVGNDKHNKGQPLHWAKEKSSDEPDAEVRHMLDFVRGLPPDPGLEPLGDLGHLASKAWRALAHLQRACDQVRAGVEASDDELFESISRMSGGNFEISMTLDGKRIIEDIRKIVYEQPHPFLRFSFDHAPQVGVVDDEAPETLRGVPEPYEQVQDAPPKLAALLQRDIDNGVFERAAEAFIPPWGSGAV